MVPDPARPKIPEVKSGSAAYYDGHVGLDRDPLPDRYLELPSLAWGWGVLVDWVQAHIFAQRGILVTEKGFDASMIMQ